MPFFMALMSCWEHPNIWASALCVVVGISALISETCELDSTQAGLLSPRWNPLWVLAAIESLVLSDLLPEYRWSGFTQAGLLHL